MQKDKIIEGLRLEIAEAQIKIVELENMGGGQVQQLERTVMESKMANARLMEENESFQLLLSEKTLSGDLTQTELFQRPRSTSRQRAHGTSLADELDDIAEDEDGPHKQFQTEIATLKDQNKALTLYINNIISKLLQHKEFENILDKNPELISGSEAASTDRRPVSQGADKAEAGGPTFLQRTRSMMGGRGRPRPTSMLAPRSDSTTTPTAHENPETAPRIPIARGQQRSSSGGHRRANSEHPGTNQVVNTTHRGPSPAASGQLSPGIVSQSGFFSSTAGNARPGGGRVVSGSTIPTINEDDSQDVHKAQRDSKIESSRNSVASEGGSDPSSPPKSVSSSGEKPTSGAVMKGSRPRPLRLVQDKAEHDEAAKKAANRASWMGWFNKGPAEKAPT